MTDGMAVSDRLEKTKGLPPEYLTLKTRAGYCADCGTWDAHGRFCAACGYDFQPESATPALT